MPREFSLDTWYTLWWLWYLPWASATDIALVTGFQATAVSNVLRRGERRGWLKSARLGRVFDAADRYVFTNTGVEELHARRGWQIFWWHSANGVRALSRRLEVVEMAYAYLPILWQSNLVGDRTCHVYLDRDRPIKRTELVAVKWDKGRLVGFSWLQRGPIDAIVTYDNGRNETTRLHLPVLWRGTFQKPSDIASVRRDMRNVLIQDERWQRLPQAQAVSWDYVPGLVIFCSERVAAAMVQRNWRESQTRIEYATRPAIIDAQGQVVRSMSPPTAWWQDFRLPPPGGLLGDIQRVVDRLTSGSYAAVNGRRSWRAFRSANGSPGATLAQIAESVGVDTTVARALLGPMVKEKVVAIHGGGYYLAVSGRGLLASSQRVTPRRTNRRWGVYERSGEYRRPQRLHNQGQAQAILELRRHGYAAFPSMGIVVEYWNQGRRYRVVPDAVAALSPGVLVAVEFERTARTPTAVLKKAKKYRNLYHIGHPLPVLFITETTEAAHALSQLGYRYLLAASLDAVRRAPTGGPSSRTAMSQGSRVAGGTGMRTKRLPQTITRSTCGPITTSSTSKMGCGGCRLTSHSDGFRHGWQESRALMWLWPRWRENVDIKIQLHTSIQSYNGPFLASEALGNGRNWVP